MEVVAFKRILIMYLKIGYTITLLGQLNFQIIPLRHYTNTVTTIHLS